MALSLLSKVVSPQSPSLSPLTHLYTGNNVLVGQVRVSTLKSSTRYLRHSISCDLKRKIVSPIVDGVKDIVNVVSEVDLVKRRDFPPEFLFGASTSALQLLFPPKLDFRDDFKDFAEICYKNFGDKVKHWTTINEPQLFGKYGYRVSLSPAGDNATDPYDAAHHIILAHATAAKLYKEKYQAKQGGEIGISIVGQWFKPHSERPQDIEAAERANAFMVGWFMDPIVYGDYPFVMRALVRDHLPHFTDEQKELVRGSYDFIGVNYYTSRYAKDIPMEPGHNYPTSDSYQHVEEKKDRHNRPIGYPPPGGNPDILIYPQGLKEVLIHIKERYSDPKIFITENGVPEGRDDKIPLEEALKDDHRIEVILGHLDAVREAMKSGVNVNGYFVWALMDCMEMGSMYNIRFGLYFTDYNDNNKRYPKKSAKWLSDFLKKRH
ncbi:hypothetical protein IFM89_000301 [Coptis chinensis]|uniref:Beta-glucosidase n=1 Tax=Coptis chinensis TaxID=261450 RepID=A0A835HC13_9MAGN|nr:hypothetical protein IFM89_000301 [Coptis chinensis]